MHLHEKFQNVVKLNFLRYDQFAISYLAAREGSLQVNLGMVRFWWVNEAVGNQANDVASESSSGFLGISRTELPRLSQFSGNT